MNAFIIAAAIVAGIATSPVPAEAHEEHKGHSSHHAPAEMQMMDGVVKKIDPSGAKVTVSHGTLANGMPPMTMVYRVKDTGWIKQMKVGGTIRYMAEDINGAMTMVHLEHSK